MWTTASVRFLGGEWGGVEFSHHRPQEANELARDRDHGDLRRSAMRDLVIALVQSVLRFPRVGDHGRGLAALPRFKRGTNLRRMAVAPRGLQQDVSAMTIAGFRNPAPSFAIAGRMLARHKSEVGHQLAWRVEAPPINDLG